MSVQCRSAKTFSVKRIAGDFLIPAVLVSTLLSSTAIADPASRAAQRRAPRPVPLQDQPIVPADAAPPIFTWDRFYVGANFGGGFGASSAARGFGVDETLAPYGVLGVSGLSTGGVLGGVQFGHNWRFGDVVAGFEADAQAAGLSGSAAAPLFTIRQSVDWFGTVRGRLGYLVMPNLLAYATGGLAVGATSHSFSFIDGLGASGFGVQNPTKSGYTVGGGLEWAFAPDWSAKLEYLYTDLGRGAPHGLHLVNEDGDDFASGAVLSGMATRFHTIRAGVNFHFSPLLPDPAGLAPPLFIREASHAFHETDTHYLFGFTEGADIDAEGEKELEFETTISAGKRRRLITPGDPASLLGFNGGSAYRVIAQKVEFEHTPSQNFQYALGVTADSHYIKGIDGLDNVNNVNFRGVSGELRYVLLGRGPASPVGVTLQVEPEYGHVSGTSGQSETALELETKLVVDTELVPNRLYGALNLVYEPELSRGVGEYKWGREATFGVTGAMSYRITPQIAFGGSVEYYRHYADNFLFDHLDGQALYMGPHLFVRLDRKLFVSLAFATQVSGHAAGETFSTDLSNFSRNKAKIHFGVEF